MDSSSLINLVNAGAHETVFQLSQHQFWLPPLVVDESGPSCAVEMLSLREQGLVDFLDDGEIDGDLFLHLMAEHGLGPGETECIAAAMARDFRLCCDDGRARRIAGELIGADRVIGSMRLLRWCVDEDITSCADAFDFFCEMKSRGGFLPDADHAFFCQ